MRAWELIKETFLRKSYIPVIHIIVCVLYGLACLLPMRAALELGRFLFALSGCVLPLLLSQGIFGDDIASGRIRVLLTKPMPFRVLYTWRLTGLVVQCLVQLAIGSAILCILQSITGRGSLNHLLLWNCLSLLLFTTLAAVSTTTSVLVKRSQNMMIVVLGAVLAAVLNNLLRGSSDYISLGLLGFIKYALPPVGLLWDAGRNYPSLARVLLLFAHSMGLTIAYAAVGITILRKREFLCECD